MDSIAPPKPLPELTAPQAPAPPLEPGPAAQAAARRIAEHKAVLQNSLTPDALEVQLDAEAQRFVQIIKDPETDETLRRYPSEGQLAYSRAIVAYLKAQSQT